MTSKTIYRISYFSVFSKVFRKLKTALLHPKKLLMEINSKREAAYLSTLNSLWHDQDYILSQINNFNPDFYESNKTVREIEHQVGRFLNMQKICDEIISDGIEGDIVEFGTWQGLGLILLSKCLSADKFKRNLIGIDSFEGLPESSTMWLEGMFDNTSLNVAQNNINTKMHKTKLLSVELIAGWFNDKEVKEKLSSTCEDIVLVHFDADLGSSTKQALELIQPYLINRIKPMYFLFDDWGCHPDEVPDAFLNWLSNTSTSLNIQAQKLSSTRFTRYYKITFN